MLARFYGKLGIVSNDLKVAERLPSTRELARRYDIHANTVSSAYRELARRGWVEFRKGSGVYVRPRTDVRCHGLGSRIVNLGEWADHTISRLDREALVIKSVYERDRERFDAMVDYTIAPLS